MAVELCYLSLKDRVAKPPLESTDRFEGLPKLSLFPSPNHSVNEREVYLLLNLMVSTIFYKLVRGAPTICEEILGIAHEREADGVVIQRVDLHYLSYDTL